MSKINKTHSLSVSRQCDLLDVPRSSFYYSPLEDGSYNEELMKQMTISSLKDFGGTSNTRSFISNHQTMVWSYITK